MFKYIKYFFHFISYCNFIYKYRKYFYEKYALSYNLFFEYYTTIDISEAPDDLILKYGNNTVLEHEIVKYTKALNSDLEKFAINEYFKTIEIKKLTTNSVGIAFGFSKFSNRICILSCMLLLITLLAALIILII